MKQILFNLEIVMIQSYYLDYRVKNRMWNQNPYVKKE